ncbi:uncharacterized protein LOC120389956 isoform X4 [Mauremys reevesii]|uniref:uncharacterized protein LOC120389956 isoform X4 n=1 Tax=Mauremys reevesii TaxID=260615 RepID=UPI00193FBB10|nr:uncharacterized protein LOC120389956 isoform X4 [Mauremys reevesii]
MAPRWERQWPGQNGAGPGCGWAGRTQPRSRTGHGGSGACCVGSNGPRIPDLISSRRHRPAWSLRTFQPSQGRRWRIPVPAPAARPAPRGTTAVPGTQTAVRQMDTSGLFQGPPGTRRRRRRRRNGWMLSQSSKTSESSSRAEKRMRPSSSCSCTACTLHVSLHSREGRTHWSRTAARQLWWRGLCTMTPALEPELETHLLRAALHEVFTLGMEKDTTQVQDLHRVLPDLLDAMLGNLLADSPDTNKLHYILDHINYCIVSRVSRERARSSTALLRSIITLPEFDQEDVMANVMHQLRIIWHLCQVPEAL